MRPKRFIHRVGRTHRRNFGSTYIPAENLGGFQVITGLSTAEIAEACGVRKEAVRRARSIRNPRPLPAAMQWSLNIYCDRKLKPENSERGERWREYGDRLTTMADAAVELERDEAGRVVSIKWRSQWGPLRGKGFDVKVRHRD